MSRAADRVAALRRRAHRRGRTGERIAAAWLVAKGYRILARRFAAAGGEIDLVAARGSVIAFVEVKQRSRMDAAETAITATKRRRFVGAIRWWLSGRDTGGRVLRVDAVFLAPWRWPRHEEAIFEVDLN